MPAKSQWEFGDLFAQPARSEEKSAATPAPVPKPVAAPEPPAEKPALPLVPPPRRVLSVSELTWEVKRLLERQVGRVWVEGEITNLRIQSSGHAYFTLKDAGSQLSCVLFRGERVGAAREALADGRKMLLEGELTVYEARGQYQLRVTAIEAQGQGALQAAFERLKQKLQAEGLFAPERKRPIPRFPRRVGLVTSPTGAAVRDVLHVLRRRGAAFEIVFVPSRVQGDGAAAEIAGAVRLLNRWSAEREPIDVILVTRGGGSLEDLWAFNEETVARALHESAVPIVSAVGHEIDFTIADFVADLRAATPSAAAELLSEGYFSGRESVAALAERLRRLARRALSDRREEAGHLAARLQRLHPRRKLDEKLQRLDDVSDALTRNARARFRELDRRTRTVLERFARVRPEAWLRDRHERSDRSAERLRRALTEALRQRRETLHAARARLRLLAPDAVLRRGYSITFDAATGRVVRSAQDVAEGARLRTQVADGEIISRVEPGEGQAP